LSDCHEFVKTTLEAVGFRLPPASAKFGKVRCPHRAYDRKTMPAMHTLCRDIARAYRHRDVDVIITTGGKSTRAANLIAEYLSRFSGRTVKVMRVVAKRLSPRTPGRKGRLKFRICGGDPREVCGKNVLLFEDIIRKQSLLPHIGKSVRYTGGSVVGIAGFVSYHGVRGLFGKWMSRRFLPRPVFGSRSPVLAEYRALRASQLGRSVLWRQKTRDLGRLIRLVFRKKRRAA
jgi:hypothetical protein